MILLNLEAPTDILVPSIASHTVIIFACASAVQKWIRRVHWAWYANVFLRLRTIEIKQKYNNNKDILLTAIRTWYTEISARGLISSPVPGLLISKLVQSGRAEGTRDGVAGYAVRRQVGRLRYLVRILRLGQFGHETGVLPVEVDEDERAEDHDANEAVSSERGSCPCFGKENIFSRTFSSI